VFRLVERLLYPIFILTAVVGLVYWYWTTTPGYALTQIVSAVKNKDSDTFEKYVDIENIAYHAVDDLLHGPARESGLFGNFDSMIGVGIISLFKPEIAEIARTQAISFIKAGTLSNVLPSSDRPPIALPEADKDASATSTATTNLLPTSEKSTGVAHSASSSFNDHSTELKDLEAKLAAGGVKSPLAGSGDAFSALGSAQHKFSMSGPGPVEKFTKNLKLQQQLKDYGLSKDGFKGVDYIKVEGPVALIGLKFMCKKLNRPFVIELKMEDTGGFWRITELSNLNDLINAYLEMREQMNTEEGATLPAKQSSLKLICADLV
jgi:hypothetical protein